jgi:hypothetical protein
MDSIIILTLTLRIIVCIVSFVNAYTLLSYRKLLPDSVIIIIIIIIIIIASAANVVCKDVDVFGARNLLLSHFV